MLNLTRSNRINLTPKPDRTKPRRGAPGAVLTLNNSSLSLPPMHLASRRTLVQALIASLLVHAVILLRVVGLSPVQPDAPGATINVVVRSEKRGEPSKPVSPLTTKPPAEFSKPVARTPATRQIAVPEPSSTVVSTVPPVPSETHDASSRATPVSPGTRASGGGVLSTAITEPAREVINADDRRNYRMSLAITADRMNAKRYPKLARERGWEGTVEMAVRGSSLLPRAEVELVRSSGRRVLDEHALDLMSQAVRVTTLPESMKGRDFSETMKWVFELKDDQ